MRAGAGPDGSSIERVAVVGTGLMGTSVALAAARAGATVSGWDADPATTARAAAVGSFAAAATLEEAVDGADLVVVCTPIPTIAASVVAALGATTDAIVTEVGSIMDSVAGQVVEGANAGDLPRFVPGHPMGGSERSGPEHASPSVLDGIVWVLSPTEASDPAAVEVLEAWVVRARRPSRPHARRPSRPPGGVRQPSAAGGLDGADEPGRHRGGGRTGDPPPGGRGVPRPHPACRLRPRTVVLDPAREPRADRAGDRPLRGAPPAAA